ncbi:hypothetical protein ALC62_00938, partial [Cyphomyrmex costatus]
VKFTYWYSSPTPPFRSDSFTINSNCKKHPVYRNVVLRMRVKNQRREKYGFLGASIVLRWFSSAWPLNGSQANRMKIALGEMHERIDFPGWIKSEGRHIVVDVARKNETRETAPVEREERDTSFCRRNNIILPIRFASIGTYSSWRKKKKDKRNKRGEREKGMEAPMYSVKILWCGRIEIPAGRFCLA